MGKKIVYVDMDNVLVDFPWGIDQLSEEVRKKYEGDIDEVPGFFADLPPIDGAIDGFCQLSQHYDTYYQQRRGRIPLPGSISCCGFKNICPRWLISV